MVLDYVKLGLKCGIEIHQQLDTKKLFCNCDGVLRDDVPDVVIKRRLRAAAGETGKVDIAAEHEQKKEKYYVYEAYSNGTCLVELDEEPPHPLNDDALNVALQVSLMLKSKPVDYIQVMRKTVVDGSNTSGFQRTALIARHGFIETKKGRVHVDTVCLEEDAARIIERGGDFVRYRLDRLGIPLVEIATKADIHYPDQCKETAGMLGMILRSTGRVKRGLGTIRQDVNVSIIGGSRIEIKGAQDLRMIPKLVENEVIRQINLIDIKKKIKKKKLIGRKVDVSKAFGKCDSNIIKNALKKDVVIGVKLEGFKGFIGQEVQVGKRLGTEMNERAKVKAGVGGIFHSDELPKYGITEKEVEKVNKLLKCGKSDGFVIVADQKDKCERALDAVVERAKEVFDGVPGEVRKANDDGTSSYLRPMPGSARMYPETDIKVIKTDTKDVVLPELISDKSKRYREKHKLGEDLAKLLAKSNKVDLFEEFAEKFKQIKPGFIAEVILTAPRSIKRQFNVEINPSDEDYRLLFKELNKGRISKDSVLSILKENKPVVQVISKYELMSDKELREQIKVIVSKNKDLPFKALIGIVMSKLKGKADGKKIVEMLKKERG